MALSTIPALKCHHLCASLSIHLTFSGTFKYFFPFHFILPYLLPLSPHTQKKIQKRTERIYPQKFRWSAQVELNSLSLILESYLKWEKNYLSFKRINLTKNLKKQNKMAQEMRRKKINQRFILHFPE